MIGNDIVDLQAAKVESKWKRPGFISKIFTEREQKFIKNALNPELEVWKLWSRKEAAYKIYNRETGIRGYFPWKLECSLEKDSHTNYHHFVTIGTRKYFTKTYFNQDFVYTIAIKNEFILEKIRAVNHEDKITKINGLSFIENSKIPVSITHHGRFERKITLVYP